jgi:Uma2 family endonuclease
VIDMPPIGSPHAGTVDYLAEAFRLACGRQVIVGTQNPIRLSQQSEPQPDVALLRPRADFYRSAHPMPADVFLLVEVADSTLAYDAQVKLPLYARHGIPEVWLVDLPNQQLVAHSDPTPTGFLQVQTLAVLSVVSPLSLPGVTVDLSGLF